MIWYKLKFFNNVWGKRDKLGCPLFLFFLQFSIVASFQLLFIQLEICPVI